MDIYRLIDEGEKVEKYIEKETYSREIFKEKGNKWINRAITYLKENYPNSLLTDDFILESEKVDKNYGTMLSILKGLKDVEEELGNLDG